MAEHLRPRRTPREYLTWRNVSHDLKESAVSAWRGHGDLVWMQLMCLVGVAVGYFGSEAFFWVYDALTG